MDYVEDPGGEDLEFIDKNATVLTWMEINNVTNKLYGLSLQ